MRRYILDSRYWLRGWYKLPTCVYDTVTQKALFQSRENYALILKCNAQHDFDEDNLSDKENDVLNKLLEEKVIRPAGKWDMLAPKQCYHKYPARYRRTVHWSLTGACNLKCLHCFMSAPHAKHGNPTTEQLMDYMDQIEECGIFNVDITGGEPLIREDLELIVRTLRKKGINIGVIITNGMLVDEKLLDMLEENDMHPVFQVSFDGVGKHDFLRGVPGAEKKALEAIKLLVSRGYTVDCSMCVHKGNFETIPETVRLLGKMGVKSLKCGPMMESGEWLNPEVKDLHLSMEESLKITEEYIPQYFEDDAPLSILLFGAFFYEKDTGNKWGIYHEMKCSREDEDSQIVCPVLKEAFYLGADGMVVPCQGMADIDFFKDMWTLKDHRLSEILRESEYVKLSYCSVGDVRRGNSECVECEYIDKCTGNCREAAAREGNYYGVNPTSCYFYKNGWEERIRAVADPA
nr:radical SAM protein [Lachnospiraceae bacterium]